TGPSQQGGCPGTTRAAMTSGSIRRGTVAQTYLGRGRDDDALSVLRGQFSLWGSGASTLDQLVRVADPRGRGEQQRAWAMAEAEQRAEAPGGTGAALIDIHLVGG